MTSWFQEFIRHFKALLQSEITQKWLRKVRTLYCTQINKTCVGHFKQQQQKTNKTNVQYERVALVCYSWFFNYLTFYTFYKELHVGGTVVKLGCITHFITLLLIMGFQQYNVCLVNEMLPGNVSNQLDLNNSHTCFCALALPVLQPICSPNAVLWDRPLEQGSSK